MDCFNRFAPSQGRVRRSVLADRYCEGAKRLKQPMYLFFCKPLLRRREVPEATHVFVFLPPENMGCFVGPLALLAMTADFMVLGCFSSVESA
jgi:hypothetical protein